MAFQPVDPRLRVSRTAPLTLSTTFQKVDFTAGAADTLNVNTFGTAADGTPMVTWDTTDKIFKINYLEDVNFTGFFFCSTTTSLLTIRATLQYRCVIPNGVSPGVPFYFPFTSQGGFTDIKEVTILTVQQNNGIEPVPLYASQVMRTNGFYIEVRLSNTLALTGTCTLNYAAFLIQGQGK